MSFVINGLVNANEFYSQHYLDEVAERSDLKPLFERWRELGSSSPAARLKAAGGSDYSRARDRFLAERKDAERPALLIDLVQPLLQAVGYELAPQSLELATGELPVLAVYRDARNHPLLMIAAAVAAQGEDDTSPLQLFPVGADGARSKADWEETLTKTVFSDDTPPRWVLLVHHEQWLLIERSKWARKALLSFALPDLFGPRDDKAYRAMAGLIGAESVLPPDGGTALLDTLDDSSHKHAFEVSTDLKYALRECIELIGNEAIRYKREVAKEKVFDRNDIDLADQLSRECLRYMYRMLFLFYIEARPELGYAPVDAQAYLKGYSLEHLRDLEQTPLTTPEARDGTYFHESINQLFALVWDGFPKRGGDQNELLGSFTQTLKNGFTIAPLQGHLFDAAKTPLLNSVKLRNSVLQKVIELMSLSRGGGKQRRGRISYGTLGINQLGAVYESLLSFRGFFAEEDLYEVRPDPNRKKAKASADEDGDGDAEDFDDSDDGDEGDDAPLSERERARDAEVDLLAAAYFVPASKISQYTDAECLFGGEPRKHPKGRFIYRLAGRAREKSASYYTPEVLTRCLVEHALKELLPSCQCADDILKLTVCEPAMGSAAFLNEAINQLAEEYLQRKQKETGLNIPHERYTEEKQRVKMYIADTNVYGVDLNPVAVELAEVSLWLNAIFKSSHVPWFGLQLCNGNSLVGARRDVFSTGQLSPGRGDKDQPERDWRVAVPRAVAMTASPAPTDVYHFLLPADGMASCSDKVVKALEPRRFEEFRQWRKLFCAPLTPDEVRRVQTLTVAAEGLWQQHAVELERVRQATSDELHVWPDEAPNRAPTSTAQKDAIYQREMLSERVKNASPYRRLKLAMDAWCALWFWPLEHALDLPTREEWWFMLETVLLGNANLTEPAPPTDLFPTTLPQTTLDFTPERDRHGQINIDALVQALSLLRVAQRVAGEQHFFHWELEFADQFKVRGGFDLVLGNPPWIKVEWNEQALLSDFDPRFAIRRLSAKEAADSREEVFVNLPQARREYLADCVTIEGIATFLNAEQNYPLLRGQQGNLYKCFMPLAWRIGSAIQALLHPEGAYDDPKAAELRNSLYPRLRAHYQFQNQHKLFAEVHNYTTFSINIYGQARSPIAFRHIANLFAVSTITASTGHSGAGSVPGIKRPGGGWEIAGHASRIINVDERTLTTFAHLYDESGTLASEARLPALHSCELVSVLEKLAQQPVRLVDLEGDYYTTVCFDETYAQSDGTIRRDTGFVDGETSFVFSGPLLFVGNPFNKTPRAICDSNRAYDQLDLSHLPDDYLPRSNYQPACTRSHFNTQVPLVKWLDTDDKIAKPITDFYRFVNRRMFGSSNERSFISAIAPKGPTHIHPVLSTSFRRTEDLLDFAAASFSIPCDFVLRSTGKTDLYESVLRGFPVLRDVQMRLRVLALINAAIKYLLEYGHEQTRWPEAF